MRSNTIELMVRVDERDIEELLEARSGWDVAVHLIEAYDYDEVDDDTTIDEVTARRRERFCKNRMDLAYCTLGEAVIDAWQGYRRMT